MTGARERLTHELRALAQAGLFFALWLGVLVVLKKLILEAYQIEFRGLSVALGGALVLSKVVLILENVSLGAWVRRQPAWVDVSLRTSLYTVGVAAVLLLEKAFEARHEHGGFVESLWAVLHHPELSHVWVNTIVVGGALLSYNMLWVIRRHLGEGGLLRLFRRPVPGS